MKPLYTTADTQEESFLRTPVPPVDFATEDLKALRALAQEMKQVMTAAHGVGLSANQIGVAKRLFVARVPEEDGTATIYTVVNPQITKRSTEKVSLDEGCLSVPDVFGIIERSARITLEGFTLAGKPLKIKAWGFLAQVFQHETDHLDGKLFIDSATDLHHVSESDDTYPAI